MFGSVRCIGARTAVRRPSRDRCGAMPSMPELFAFSVRLRTYGRWAFEPDCIRRAGVQLVATMSSSGLETFSSPCSRRTIQRRTIFSPRCRQRTTSACLPHLELVALPLGLALYESGGAQDYVYLPTDQHRVAALRHERRRLGGDRGGGQRGHGGHRAVHGRRDHARAARWCRAPGTPTGSRRALLKSRVRPRRARCSTCCCATRRR